MPIAICSSLALTVVRHGTVNHVPGFCNESIIIQSVNRIESLQAQGILSLARLSPGFPQLLYSTKYHMPLLRAKTKSPRGPNVQRIVKSEHSKTAGSIDALELQDDVLMKSFVVRFGNFANS